MNAPNFSLPPFMATTLLMATTLRRLFRCHFTQDSRAAVKRLLNSFHSIRTRASHRLRGACARTFPPEACEKTLGAPGTWFYTYSGRGAILMCPTEIERVP